MKKIMIGILVIIPVIILAVVSAVSVVVSTRAHIGVEEISFDKNKVAIAFTGEIYDVNDYVKVTILPEKASDKTCTWTIDENSIRCFDTAYQEEYEYYINNKDEDQNVKEVLPPVTLVDSYGNAVDENTSGRFKVNTSCTFVIKGSAETVQASCTVQVADDELKSVEVVGENRLLESESTLLDVYLTPVNATTTKVEWLSSDESVLTVDSNGVAHGVKAGNAVVKARVYVSDAEYIDSADFDFTVEKNVTLLGADVVTHTRRISLSALGVEATDIINTVNCTVDGEKLVIADDKEEANFETVNGVCTLFVSDGIEIKNKSIFAYNENEDYILAVGDALNFEVGWKSAFKTDEISATWTVGDERVATIDGNGVLVGKADGIVTVTVTAGEYSDEIEVMVRSKVVSVIIDRTKTEYSDAGLALEYVIPTLRYKDISVNTDVEANYIDVEIVFPEPTADKQAFYEAFTFELLENGEASDKGYFVGNRLYFDHEKVTEKTTLTVKVTAKYPKFKDSLLTTDSVEIKVVDGVAIDSYSALRKTADAKQYNAVLVNSITLYDVAVGTFDGDTTKCVYEGKTASQLHMYKSYYGNGYMYSAEPGQLDNNMSALLYVKGDDVTISNGWFRGNNTTKDVISTEDTDGLKGVCVMAGALYAGDRDSKGNDTFVRGNKAEYCIFENADVLYKPLTCECYIDGCIFRNSSGVGIYTRCWTLKENNVMYTTLTIKNSVMSNLTGLGINLDFNKYSSLGDEYRDQMIEEGRVTTFNQLGFLDIYNWQSVSTMRFLPDTAIGTSDAEIAIAQMVNALLREKITDKSLDSFRYSYNREEYFHLGFMSTGMLDKSCLSGVMQDTRLTVFTSDMVSGIGNLVKNTCYFFVYDNETEDITPSSTYTINRKLINRLHGVGVEYNESIPYSFI